VGKGGTASLHHAGSVVFIDLHLIGSRTDDRQRPGRQIGNNIGLPRVSCTDSKLLGKLGLGEVPGAGLGPSVFGITPSGMLVDDR